jgi:hypothetical protein
MKMFCFSDHTRMHLHPTGLGPMGAAANGRYGAIVLKNSPVGSAAKYLFVCDPTVVIKITYRAVANNNIS